MKLFLGGWDNDFRDKKKIAYANGPSIHFYTSK